MVDFHGRAFKNSLFSFDEMTSPLFDNQVDGMSRNGLSFADLDAFQKKKGDNK